MIRRQKILALRSTGQFANCAWATLASYFAFRNIYHNHPVTLYLPEKDDLSSILKFHDSVSLEQGKGWRLQLMENGPRRQLLRNLLFFEEQKVDGVTTNYINVGHTQVTLVDSWKFAGNTAQKGRIMCPDEFLNSEVKRAWRVVLHVRRGDYASWRNGLFYFDLEELLSCFSFLNFDTVVTDDVNIRKQAKELGYTTGNGSLKEDYELMLEAKVICGPPSSLSMLAAWQGRANLYWLMRDDNLTPLPVDLGVVTGFYCFSKGVIIEDGGVNQLRLCGESEAPYLNSFYN